MAIYHLHMKIIQRSKGRNVVAAAAYRRGIRLRDKAERRYFDYRKRHTILHRELNIPQESPQWLTDLLTLYEQNATKAIGELWNKINLIERRKDAQLAREIEFSLPIELSLEQNIQLAREFIQEQLVLRGMIADWSIHWEDGNPHVHVLLSMRRATEHSFGKREVEWNKPSLCCELRQQWAHYANYHLKLNHHDIQIDDRSYAKRGIDLIPTIHHGKAVRDMHGRGIERDMMQETATIGRHNLERISTNPHILFKKIASEQSTFTITDVTRLLGNYINDKARIHSSTTSAKVSAARANEMLQSDEKEALFALNPDTLASILETLSQKDSVFTERDLAKALLPYTDNADAFVNAFLQIKSSSKLIHLGVAIDGRDRYTTQTIFKRENELQHLAEVLKHRQKRTISLKKRMLIIQAHEKAMQQSLSDEQRHAVLHLTNNASIACLVGRAGTGKSYSLKAAKAIWENVGYRVQGIALAGIAVEGLTRDANINSRTIASFLYELENQSLTLSANDVIVMDEAGMSDAKSLHAILTAVHQARAKLVLIGDPAQLQPISSGAIFRAITERVGYAELQYAQRQRAHEWQQQATRDFSQGRINDAMMAYYSHDCLHREENAELSQTQLIKRWVQLNQANISLKQRIVLAFTNKEVNALNEQLRQKRIESGDIHAGIPIMTTHGERFISVGERLLFLKNDRTLNLTNGKFGQVTQIDYGESGQALSLSVELDDGTTTRFLMEHYSDFTYGYATTIHKSQGMTVDHSLVYLGEMGWDRHLIYVAASRHRESCHFYTDCNAYPSLNHLFKRLNKAPLKDSVLDFPYHFAKRRHIQSDSLRTSLKNHLKEKLIFLKDTLRDRIDEMIAPNRYWQRKIQRHAQLAARQRHHYQREQAKMVAAYMDAKRQVGEAMNAVKQTIKALQHASFNECPKTHPVWQTFVKCLAERDRLAAQIIHHADIHQQTIDFYQLSVDQLTKEAQRHELRAQVMQYAHDQKQGKIIHRDQLASTIQTNIKIYYPFLKQLNVDISQLKKDAFSHRRRQWLCHASSIERQALRTVERYRQLNLELFHQKMKHACKIKIKQLIDERNELAHCMMTSLEHHAKALDFYLIGHSTSLTCHEQQIKANRAWYYLQSYASHYQLKQQVQHALPEEKKFWRLLKRHQKTHQQIGQLWSKHLKANPSPSSRKQFIADQLIAKRDAIAAQLTHYALVLELMNIDVNVSALKWDKIHQHANAHQHRLNMIKHWQYQRELSSRHLHYFLMPNAMTAELYLMDDEFISLHKSASRIQPKLNRFSFALKESNSSIDEFKLHLQALETIQNMLKVKEQEKISILTDEKRILKAKAIANQTRCIEGTLAERYLREHRHIQGKLPSDLRFHPECYHPHVKQKFPALVAIARDEHQDISAVQVIYLDRVSAQKANIPCPKLTFGVLSRKAIGVAIQSHPSNKTIAVAEGIETALSIREARNDLTIYAVLGSGNFARVPHDSNTKHIIFCADNDGENAATARTLQKAAQQLSKKDIDIWIAKPLLTKTDFNDVLKNEGKDVIKRHLNDAMLYTSSQTQQMQDALSSVVDDNTYDTVLQKVIHEFERYEKALQEAEKKAFIGHRVHAKEQLGKYAENIAKNKKLYQQLKHQNPEIGKYIARIVEQNKDVEL